MQTPMPARLRQLEPLTEILETVAMAAAKRAKKIGQVPAQAAGLSGSAPGA